MCSVMRWVVGSVCWRHTPWWRGAREKSVIIFYTIPPDELFLGLVKFRPIKVLPAVTAVRLVFVLDDFLAPRANGEAVPVLVDSDCVYSHGQTICRREQYVKDGVSERTLLWSVLPDISGVLMAESFESKLHFIITLKHRWLTRTLGCIYVRFCPLSLKIYTI